MRFTSTAYLLTKSASVPQSPSFGQFSNVHSASEHLHLRERGGDVDSHLSPNSAHTVVNLNFDSNAGAAAHCKSVDGDEKTITTSNFTNKDSTVVKPEAGV